jgi:integrase
LALRWLGQAAIASLARLKRIPVSASTLHHTLALGYSHDNPGQFAELADLLGHESLDTTTIYTRASRDDLAANPKHPYLNAAG